MTNLTATFSTGYTDAYKGDRDVRAAWLLTTPEGRTFSGHSLNRQNAAKTASSTASQKCPFHELVMHGGGLRGRYSYTPAAAANYLKIAKERGFDTIKAYNADAKAKRADWVARCAIEIVDL